MQQALSISELAKTAGVTSKTLRHWEHLGLLPKAMRTHTGYRVFDPQITQYIEFIQKAKTVGLTLKEAKRLMELARKGKNPCPQVRNCGATSGGMAEAGAPGCVPRGHPHRNRGQTDPRARRILL
jgi:DNA-binding transcriptional MerR regulator